MKTAALAPALARTFRTPAAGFGQTFEFRFAVFATIYPGGERARVMYATAAAKFCHQPVKVRLPAF